MDLVSDKPGEEEWLEINEGDDISVHSLSMMPVSAMTRAESKESLHSITRQSEFSPS